MLASKSFQEGNLCFSVSSPTIEVNLKGSALLQELGKVVASNHDSAKNELLLSEHGEELLGNEICVRGLGDL